MPSLTGLGILSFPSPGTAVPGYRLFRPYGTGPARLDIVTFYRRLIAIQNYIARQKEYRQKIDSATEFELLLKRHGFELRD